jgi:dihydroorotase-like cyclic amidohydrolase
VCVGRSQASTHTSNADLLVRNARLIDGTGAPPTPADILIRDGWIQEISATISPNSIEVIEVGGATVLPGLVDSHVHLEIGPGSLFRGDSQRTLASLRRRHLCAYLACGVTTVLDAGISRTTAAEIRSWLAQGNAGPRFLTLGEPLATPAGYQWEATRSVGTSSELKDFFDQIESMGAVGVKVLIERGWSPLTRWPIPSGNMLDSIGRFAQERSLPIFVHSRTEECHGIALDIGARALAHVGLRLPLRRPPLYAGLGFPEPT